MKWMANKQRKFKGFYYFLDCNEKKSIIVLIFLDMLMRQGFPIILAPFLIKLGHFGAEFNNDRLFFKEWEGWGVLLVQILPPTPHLS